MNRDTPSLVERLTHRGMLRRMSTPFPLSDDDLMMFHQQNDDDGDVG